MRDERPLRKAHEIVRVLLRAPRGARVGRATAENEQLRAENARLKAKLERVEKAAKEVCALWQPFSQLGPIRALRAALDDESTEGGDG